MLRRTATQNISQNEVSSSSSSANSDIIFARLPSRLFFLILEMIPPNEVSLLRGVCKWFKQFIDSSDNLVAGQVFSLFFSKQVDFFCEYGDNDQFILERTKKNYIISNSSKSQHRWRELLKTHYNVRIELYRSVDRIFQHDAQQQYPEGGLQLGTGYQDIIMQEDEGRRSRSQSGKLGLPTTLQWNFDLGKNDTEEENANDSLQQKQQVSSPFKFVFDGQKEDNHENSDQIEQINFFGSLNFVANQSNVSSDGSSTASLPSGEVDFKHVKKASKMASAAVKMIWSTLRDPPLPILKLRRENVGNHCNTWFQNKLAEVLWDGAAKQLGMSLISIGEEQPLVTINAILRDNKAFFIHEMVRKCEEKREIKDDLLNLRYYFYNNRKLKESQTWAFNPLKRKSLRSDQPIIFEFAPNHNEDSDTNLQRPMLLSFIESLADLIRFRCQLIYEYLRCHLSNMSESFGSKKNGYDILSEYTIAWNSYVAFLNEVEEPLKDVFSILNECFVTIFPEYPAHPDISLWRLMAKLWIKEVYNKDELKENLFGCFLKILSIRRHNNFLYQMNQIQLDSRIENQYYMPEPLEDISLTLLNNLTKTRNFSLLDFGEGYDYYHSFFSKNSYYEDSLLTSFVESVLDLSINEISVHYLGHSKIQTDSPYSDLENQLLDSSCTFYKHQKNMFLTNPSQYLLFLQADLKYLSKIFKERSILALRLQIFKHWTDMFKEIMTSLIPRQLINFSNKDDRTKTLLQSHALTQMQKEVQEPFIQLLNSILSENPTLISSPFSEINFQFESQLIHQLLMVGDDKYKQDIQNYNDLCKANEFMLISDQDLEIEEINSVRGLPIALQQQEQYYFFLTIEMTNQILQDTIASQSEYLQSQSERNNNPNNHDNENDSYSSEEDEQQPHQQNDLANQSPSQIPRRQAHHREILLPVYNSDDDTGQNHDDFFGALVGRKQSNAHSEFSLGLMKEESRISNPNGNNIFGLIEPQGSLPPAEDMFKFTFQNPQFDSKSDQNQQDDAIQHSPQRPLMFPMLEKKDSSLNSVAFTFALKSNDVTPIVSSDNFFSSVMRSANQSSSLTSSTDLFSNTQMQMQLPQQQQKQNFLEEMDSFVDEVSPKRNEHK